MIPYICHTCKSGGAGNRSVAGDVEGVCYKEALGIWGSDEKFYVMIMVVITELRLFLKTYRNVH